MFLNKKLDEAYSNIDNMLFDKRFDDVEELFETIDVENTDPLILLSILTATDSWKKILNNRESFYKRVEIVVRQKFKRKKAEELLYDLK